MKQIQIADRTIGSEHPTYFIADISANHDGDLERAKALIHLCAEAGAPILAAKVKRLTFFAVAPECGGGLSRQ